MDGGCFSICGFDFDYWVFENNPVFLAAKCSGSIGHSSNRIGRFADLDCKVYCKFGYIRNTYRSRATCTNNFVLLPYSFCCLCLFSAAFNEKDNLYGNGSGNNCFFRRYKMAKDKSGQSNHHVP
jgi:hypothetical protein